ncbi:hypothetical protein QYC27_08670 [Thermosynechococcus sp. PP45]|uniref:DUF7219 family protein n=1 Tax=unclassified Thermosynechococcus TaxID=2622553 RepID=UPI002673A746|nr:MULTISPECIES: hypothetical protein [unclassified Thermosynechococcus]MDR5639027.1 hypothetical protein [Thermosynechococcus sp. PP42]WKT80370.1 hypothetical protein QYC27_08670 [Thermosynechococcus sp. PP45]WNC23980.1 hypothetical protein RHH26_08665 [Thermosynechococcus sp. PP551]WNC26558.1 hypothetical protein RHH27_08660 [Thermosynechococcus sp. PP555]
MSESPTPKFDKEKFLFPTSRYHGAFTPQNLAFNANLQEFAQRVSYICGLETGGKISSEEAYNQIKVLWKQLKKSRHLLFANIPPDEDADGSDSDES